jgi:hypothetical protein
MKIPTSNQFALYATCMVLAACSQATNILRLPSTFGAGADDYRRLPQSYSVLYSFGGALSDGGLPVAALINVKGRLYGTTSEGGAFNCGTYNCGGTAFSITAGGLEKVLHSFGKVPAETAELFLALRPTALKKSFIVLGAERTALIRTPDYPV